MSKLLTADEVKKTFEANGVSLASWARTKGFTAQEVYKVLNGQTKAKYGRAHDIAVALGMKAKPKTNPSDHVAA